MIDVEVSNRQAELSIDANRLRDVVAALLREEGVSEAEISVAVVGDHEIHELNRHYLQHDYPTDVLSFVLERSATRIEGEIIVSAEMAIARCRDYQWDAFDELMLYVVHGALHLVGYDDNSDESKSVMRERETHHLSRVGVSPADTPLRAGPNGPAHTNLNQRDARE